MYRALEKNLIPDFLIRTGIRGLLRKRLRELYEGGLEARQARFNMLIEFLKNSPIAVETDAANDQHYELPPEFFELVLGKHLKYSCGLWEEGVETLDEAEALMLQTTLNRAELEDGMSVLDLGCGWGSFTLYAAERMPGVRFTSVSNSAPQRRFIEGRAQARGLKNVQVITQDINGLELPRKFDRVVSVEMFEHMRNYQALLSKVASFLREDGKLFVHIFSHQSDAYLFEVKDESDWMAKYFFTGGIMPSDHLLLYFDDHFSIERHWRVNGRHYERTANAWLAEMDAERNAVMAVFERTYGAEQATKWWAYWRTFFMACAELWGFRGGDEWFVSHYLFKVRS